MDGRLKRESKLPALEILERLADQLPELVQSLRDAREDRDWYADVLRRVVEWLATDANAEDVYRRLCQEIEDLKDV